MKVTLTNVPASGEGSTKDVTVKKTGASVGDVLAEAGIDPQIVNIQVNGEPGTTATHVSEGAAVTVTEKAAGS